MDGEQCHGTSGISFCSMMARLRGLRSLPCSSGVASKFICTGFLHKHTKRVMLMFAIISLTRTYLQSLLSWKSRDCNPPTSTAPSGARQKAGRRHSCSIFGSRVSAVMATACGGFYLLGTLRIVVVVVVVPPYVVRRQDSRAAFSWLSHSFKLVARVQCLCEAGATVGLSKLIGATGFTRARRNPHG